MSLTSYTIGFVLSILLTFFAFWLVPTLPTAYLYIALVAAALLQLLVQLVFFLHLGHKGNRSNLTLFAFMLIIVAILVGGSLWIMDNLQHQGVPSGPEGTYLKGIITPQNELD